MSVSGFALGCPAYRQARQAAGIRMTQPPTTVRGCSGTVEIRLPSRNRPPAAGADSFITNTSCVLWGAQRCRAALSAVPRPYSGPCLPRAGGRACRSATQLQAGADSEPHSETPEH